MLEEVRSAVFSMDPDSAPCNDGFPGLFYRHAWDIISGDLLLVVQEFLSWGSHSQDYYQHSDGFTAKKTKPHVHGSFPPHQFV